ncbi:MAG: hypothetical protein ACYCZF_17415 [Anaerolineae bacterium]
MNRQLLRRVGNLGAPHPSAANLRARVWRRMHWSTGDSEQACAARTNPL